MIFNLRRASDAVIERHLADQTLTGQGERIVNGYEILLARANSKHPRRYPNFDRRDTHQPRARWKGIAIAQAAQVSTEVALAIHVNAEAATWLMQSRSPRWVADPGLLKMPPVGLGTLATNERNLEESCLETSEARKIARVRVDVTGMVQPLCYLGIVKT